MSASQKSVLLVILTALVLNNFTSAQEKLVGNHYGFHSQGLKIRINVSHGGLIIMAMTTEVYTLLTRDAKGNIWQSHMYGQMVRVEEYKAKAL